MVVVLPVAAHLRTASVEWQCLIVVNPQEAAVVEASFRSDSMYFVVGAGWRKARCTEINYFSFTPSTTTYLLEYLDDHFFGGGRGTDLPASTDDCSEVGGSIIGCRTGCSDGTAKSRAAEPGIGPRNPSLTPCVLEAS